MRRFTVVDEIITEEAINARGQAWNTFQELCSWIRKNALDLGCSKRRAAELVDAYSNELYN